MAGATASRDKASLLDEARTKIWVPNPGPQIAALLSPADELFYGGGAGGGKALDIKTRIATATGFVPMEHIKVGDKVFDNIGMPCEVIACSSIMHGHECFEIVFEDGTTIVADAEHLWLTVASGIKAIRSTTAIAATLCQDHVIIGGLTGWMRRRIVACNPTPSVPVRCIAVDSPTNLYLAGLQMVPTHNTDLLLGAALTQHTKSIIFRREYKQLEGLRERSSELWGHIGRWNGQKELWRVQYNGAMKRIEFGAVQLEQDKIKYQGRDHDLKCVGRGTLVMMADGTAKAIEAVVLGDRVMTLEGSRSVTRVLPMRRDLGVRVTAFNRSGEAIAEQVQSQSHSTLAASGKWASYAEELASRSSGLSGSAASGAASVCAQSESRSDQFPLLRQASSWLDQLGCGAGGQSIRDRLSFVQACCAARASGLRYLFAATRFCSDRIYGQLSVWKSQVVQKPLEAIRRETQQIPAPALLSSAGQASRASFVCGGPEVRGTDFEGSWYRPSTTGPRPSEFGLPGLQQPARALSWLGSKRGLSGRDGRCDPAGSLPQGYPDHCSGGSRPYDEPPRRWSDHGSGQADDLTCFLQLADVGQPNPSYFADDDLGRIPRHNHHGRMYCHPYTKDKRQAAVGILAFRCVFSPFGVIDLFDIEVEEVNHYITVGGFINKNCFDEAPHLTYSQYRFLSGWNRTANPNQRTRIICAGNPPTDAEGDWVVTHWAPWLDPSHPNPAKDGELRWFAVIKGEDVEVEGPDPIIVEGEDAPVHPKSRTFIRALYRDNPWYVASGYVKTLQAMPEPLRSQMLLGDFGAGRKDNERQVIPTEWVLLAQSRWTDTPPWPMDALGVDVARGGVDKTVLTPRHRTWFGRQASYPGASTPDGWAALQMIVQAVPPQSRPMINIDIIGVGSSVYDLCIGQGLNAHAMDARHKTDARDEANVLSFVNKRAEWWWKMREALDPLHGDDLALPPDRELLADLTSARWEPRPNGILIEAKDDIIERIGRSPDKGESLILAHAMPTRLPMTKLI